MEKEAATVHPRKKFDDILFAFDFKLSLDQTRQKRSIYTLFDVLGDVGGLLDGLRLLGGILMSIYTFIIGSPLKAFLVTSLFKRSKVSKNHS